MSKAKLVRFLDYDQGSLLVLTEDFNIESGWTARPRISQILPLPGYRAPVQAIGLFSIICMDIWTAFSGWGLPPSAWA
ncbi:MAG: hypothetical protein ACYDGS_07170 [Thermoleophilia bacterium]